MKAEVIIQEALRLAQYSDYKDGVKGQSYLYSTFGGEKIQEYFMAVVTKQYVLMVKKRHMAYKTYWPPVADTV